MAFFGTIYAVDSGYEARVWCEGAWWHRNALLSRDITFVTKLCYIHCPLENICRTVSFLIEAYAFYNYLQYFLRVSS